MRTPPARGFTLVEMMIVMGVIGILASVAIPNYLNMTARSRRSEMVNAIGKFKFFFKNAHDNNGTFAQSDVAEGASSAVNPDPGTYPTLGQPGIWDSKRTGWSDMPFGMEGGLRMRYVYTVQDKDHVLFQACGSFPGFGVAFSCPGFGGLKGNYSYSELMLADGNTDPAYPIEIPQAF